MGAVDQALAADIIRYEWERVRGGTEVPRSTHERLLRDHLAFATANLEPHLVDAAAERLWKFTQMSGGTAPVSIHVSRLRAFLHDTGFGPKEHS